MSGPAVLKTSAWGARILNDMDYQFVVHINWLGQETEQGLRDHIENIKASNPKKQLKNLSIYGLPQRLWDYFLEAAEIEPEKPWAELPKKQFNKLVEKLINDQHQVTGKTTFKEEFVTAGGIDLADVDFNTMQSQVVPNLHFAGEVLNIDGVTGGFNFQAAWTTGFIAGKHCLS